MAKGSIGKKRMERYKKQHNLKRFKVILPRLADISNITNKLRSNGGANFLKNDPSSSPKQNLFLRSLSGVINEQCAAGSPLDLYMDDELNKSKNMIDKSLEGVPWAEKKDDHYAKGLKSSREDFISLEACPMYDTQIGKFENTIDQKIGRSNETYCALRGMVGKETRPIRVSLGRDRDSVSTFIEKAEESSDEPHFRVFNMEVESDDEICIHME